VYKKPFGALRHGETVSFTLRFPAFMSAEMPSLAVFRPGDKEKFIHMEYAGQEDHAFNIFTCSYLPEDVGVHYYYFTFLQNGARQFIKRKGASVGDMTGTELFQLTVFDSEMQTPDWIKGGVIYQIFPDRFAHAEYDDMPPIPTDRHNHNRWDDIPEWQPNPQGVITNSDYFGGNLRGIEANLPYLESLGVTCIYLCPIFEAHENHRYCTACYERIDPMLGTVEDFRRLCARAKERGISVILDGVFSHTGADSVYFNKFGRYGERTGAYRDPESPYRDWYSFVRYPAEYDSWWGISTLPNVNENNPSYTAYICGENGILQRWLDEGARGWRLDVADELPDEFLDSLRKSVKAKGGDKIIYGEVWEDASNKESYGVRRRYLIGHQLDSVMNYPFKEYILEYIKHSNSRFFYEGIMTILEHYPKPAVDTLMNFISTHDTERAITRLGGEPVGDHDRKWQSEQSLTDEQYTFGSVLLRCAMVLQYFLPGVPCVYYGDEAGMEGYKDPFNRRTFPWGEENTQLQAYARKLSHVRASCSAFAEGRLEFVEVTDHYCAFLRIDDERGNAAAVFLNKSKKAKKFEVKSPFEKYEINALRLPYGMREQDEKISKGVVAVAPFDYAVLHLKRIGSITD
jgi:glycosidase